jgi:hypothetical protein
MANKPKQIAKTPANPAAKSAAKPALNNTPKPAAAYKDIIAALDDATKADTLALVEMMQRISGQKPKIWNVSTIGFDTYHYKYESGREGDCHVLGFNARKGKFTIYLMDGTSRYAALFPKLGKHTTSQVCLYFKRLSDLELPTLEKILTQSYTYVKSQDGKMHRAE